MASEVSSKTGELATNIQITNIDTASPKKNPNELFIGARVSQKVGKINAIGRKLVHFGKTRSRYKTCVDAVLIMVLDYALTVNNNLQVLIVAEDGFLPTYAQPGDAGADLRARVAVVVPAMGRVLVPTGVSIALPDGYVALVHPRSGLAHKSGITVLNTPGTVDAGYRGEIAVNLYNSTNQDFEIQVGDRIAQIVFQQVERANFIQVENLPQSDRGEGGHGSTGKN